MSFYIGKWCKHCQKTNHNTHECWSTHAVNPWESGPEPQGGWLGVMKGSLASHDKAKRNAGVLGTDGSKREA